MSDAFLGNRPSFSRQSNDPEAALISSWKAYLEESAVTMHVPLESWPRLKFDALAWALFDCGVFRRRPIVTDVVRGESVIGGNLF